VIPRHVVVVWVPFDAGVLLGASNLGLYTQYGTLEALGPSTTQVMSCSERALWRRHRPAIGPQGANGLLSASRVSIAATVQNNGFVMWD